MLTLFISCDVQTASKQGTETPNVLFLKDSPIFGGFVLRKKFSSELPEDKEKSKEKSKEKTTDVVLRLMRENPYVTTSEIAEECGLSNNSIYKAIRKLRERNMIEREGGDKGGRWKILILP